MPPTSENKYRGTIEYQLVYCALINAASNRGTVTYQEIAEIMGLPSSGNYMSRETGGMVGTISKSEVDNGRPMLSAIVVRVDGKPGDGLYNWAHQLGRLQDEGKEAESSFWEKEKRAVYDVWQKSFKDS